MVGQLWASLCTIGLEHKAKEVAPSGQGKKTNSEEMKTPAKARKGALAPHAISIQPNMTGYRKQAIMTNETIMYMLSISLDALKALNDGEPFQKWLR